MGALHALTGPTGRLDSDPRQRPDGTPDASPTEPCDGCGDTTHPTETSTRVIIRDSADWRLHEECYRAWAGIKDTGRLGVGTIVLRQRERLAAVEAAHDALVLSMMRFAHEIRSPKELDLPREGEGWHKKEMALAHQLIDTLASKWEPTQLADTYTDVLRKTIEAKVEGKEIVVEEGPRRPKVANLMKALQESLKDGDRRKEPARAAARGKAGRRRTSRKAA